MSELKLIKTLDAGTIKAGKKTIPRGVKVFKDEKGVKSLLLIGVRLSFPAFGHMKTQKSTSGEDVESYSCQAMIPKAGGEEIKELLDSICRELMTANEAKIPKANWFITDGDESEREEYADHWIVSCSDKKNRPGVRDETNARMFDPTKAGTGADVEAQLTRIDNKFYGGCWGDLLIRPWYFNGKAKGKSETYPKRIPAGLSSVRFAADDEKFGSGSINDDDVFGQATNASSGDDGMDDDGDDI